MKNSSWSVSEWGLQNLALTEDETPPLTEGEVLVEFQASSLNYRDLLVVKGLYNPKFERPLVPCSDGFGKVVEFGPGVEPELLGKSFLSRFCPDWDDGAPDARKLRDTTGGPRHGCLRKYAVLKSKDIFVLETPEALTPAEWATLPCAGVTAWNCLMDQAQLQAGQTLLLLGTGGVSMFGLQIAKALGCRVLLLSGSAEKRQAATEMGADAVCCYKENPKWSKWVLEQTGGVGADVVLETGGAGTLAQSLKSVKIGGHVSLIGVLSGHSEALNILPLVMKAVTVQGAVVGHAAHCQELMDFYLKHQIKPVVHESLPFERAPEAFAMLESASHLGKVCINHFPADRSTGS